MKEKVFYFSVSCLNNFFTQLVNKQTYYSAAHERDKISWRVWTTLMSAMKNSWKKQLKLSQKKIEIQFVINNFRHCIGELIFFFDGHKRSQKLNDSQIWNFNLNHLKFMLELKTFILKPRGYWKNQLLSNKEAEKSI